ncbi:hypothetical protein NDU88_002166 [Pleurodeles waltl]|uniref:Uncharacterized protein n=1 Tax=Pleurodeles waltl TaxID=8319 RepID=A0AAV7S9I1_PLEWA|nr:hypothetical protein NDU88_002166 [Pleurodeles waltl]
MEERGIYKGHEKKGQRDPGRIPSSIDWEKTHGGPEAGDYMKRAPLVEPEDGVDIYPGTNSGCDHEEEEDADQNAEE